MLRRSCALGSRRAGAAVRWPLRRGSGAAVRLLSTSVEDAPAAQWEGLTDGKLLQEPIPGTAAPLNELSASPVSAPEEVAAAVVSVPSAVAEAVPLGYWPPDMALRLIDEIHSLGLPWWAAIVGSTLLVRSALLPLALKTTFMQAKMQGLKREMAPLQARMQASGGTDITVAREMQELYDREGVNPMRMIALPFLQMPIFVSFFFGLRRLADSFPEAHNGGILWFTDLGIVDASYTLPVISSASALALVGLAMPAPPVGAPAAEQEMHYRMRLLMGGLTLVSLPVACNMPASVLVFWITNNAFSLAYSTTVLIPASRAALGLPPLPTAADYPVEANAGGAGVGPMETPSVDEARAAAAASMAQLGETLMASGKLAEGAAMHKRAYVLTVEARGEAHEETLERLWQHVEAAESAGLHQDAIESFRRWRLHAPADSPPPDDEVEARIAALELRSGAVDASEESTGGK